MASLPIFQFDGGQTDEPLGAAPNQWKHADNLVISQDLKLENAPGGELTDILDPRTNTAASVNRIDAAISFEDTVFKAVGDSLQYFDGAAQVNLVGPGSAEAFASAYNYQNVVTFSYWNDHMLASLDNPTGTYRRPMMFFKDTTFKLRTIGLPIGPSATTTASSGTAHTYGYAFVYKYSYTVNGVTFLQRSRPFLRSVQSNAITGGNPVSVAALADITNATGQLYDVTNISKEIYRTANNGTVYYLVATVAHGTSTYSDVMTDATLVTQQTAYWTGGVKFNDRPPNAQIVHATTNYAYYAKGNEVSVTGTDGELYLNRLWQSKVGEIGSVPAGFYVDLEDEIVAVSSVRSIPVVFCKRGSVYRIDGVFDSFGRGGMTATKISETAGGIGQLSVVQGLDGLYFGGLDGWYFTDSYNVTPLSDELRDTYQALVNTDLKRRRMVGAYDKKRKRVYWTCRDAIDGDALENNSIACMDARFNKFSFWNSGTQTAFSIDKGVKTITTGSPVIPMADTSEVLPGQYLFCDGFALNAIVLSVIDNTSVTVSKDASLSGSFNVEFVDWSQAGPQLWRQCMPSAVLMHEDDLHVCDTRGYVIRRDESIAELPKIDPNTAVADWEKIPNYYNYVSSAIDMGLPDLRKYGTQVAIHARSKLNTSGNLTLQPMSENDANNVPDLMKPIQVSFTIPWGDPGVSYGDPVLWTSISRLVIQKRRFPANALRFSYKQLHMTPMWANIQNSDSVGAADVTGSLVDPIFKVVTLSTLSDGWDDDVVDKVFTTSYDLYTEEYPVVSRESDTVIVVLDVNDTLPVAGAPFDWLTRGVVNTDTVSIVGFVYNYEVMDNTVKSYQGGTNANAT